MSRPSSFNTRAFLIWMGVIAIGLIILWRAITAAGVPDPGDNKLNTVAAIVSCGILVFREGLEAVLVLAAISAAVIRKKQAGFTRSIIIGVALGLVATVATWFVVVALLSEITVPELDVQAATGLLAIVVLLVVMNWFFHNVYWTGWISHHTKRRRKLVESQNPTALKMFEGFALLGFTAIYREGFEVVLFLQQLRLRAGGDIVLTGTTLGLILTAVVALLTFVAHQHLPYKKMLIVTGVLLAVVLLVMVGESVQEMQQANWVRSTPLDLSIPQWSGVWFSVFPNRESLAAQAVAAVVVFGSYFSAQQVRRRRIRSDRNEA